MVCKSSDLQGKNNQPNFSFFFLLIDSLNTLLLQVFLQLWRRRSSCQPSHLSIVVPLLVKMLASCSSTFVLSTGQPSGHRGGFKWHKVCMLTSNAERINSHRGASDGRKGERVQVTCDHLPWRASFLFFLHAISSTPADWRKGLFLFS